MAISNKNFNHQDTVISMFSEMGFNDIHIQTSLTNGISHYVSVYDFDLLDANKLFSDMFVFDGDVFITVRVSDHDSNLERICNGVSAFKISLSAFKQLIKNGAITSKN